MAVAAATLGRPEDVSAVPAPAFWGYRRPDGGTGVRNHLLVVPSVICANTVAQRVAALIPGAVAIPHPHGCAQVGDDVALTEQVLAKAAASPNVGAALVVGLGCETCQASQVADLARALAPSKPIESYYIQEVGGSIKAIAAGVERGKQLMAQIAAQQREAVPLDRLAVALYCGEPDASTAAASLPVLGDVAERVLGAGGTVILSETVELPFLAARAARLGFAERPDRPGLFVMEAPAHAAVALSAMAAGGAQVCLFATGGGSPVGHAICPVIKVCGNRETLRRMEDNIDFSTERLTASDQHSATTTVSLGRDLFALLLDVCNGQLTNAEIIGHQEFAIHRIGPTV